MLSELKPMAIQHVNSCVYELMVDQKGETRHLFKQVNNAIPVTKVSIERHTGVSFNELAKLSEPEMSSEPKKCFYAYPMTEKDKDTKGNFTVVSGIMLETRKRDPSEPIAVSADDAEARSKALAAALTPYVVEVPFMLAFWETDKLMFDITLSHIPKTAISEVTSAADADVPDDFTTAPVGMDPSHPLLAPIDMAYWKDIRYKVQEYMMQHPDTIEETLCNLVLPEIVKKVTGFDDGGAQSFIERVNAYNTAKLQSDTQA